MDCSPLGSSVHGILQARILEWVAIPFSRGLFLTQGLNQHLLHWQVDFLPLMYLGSINLYSLCQSWPVSILNGYFGRETEILVGVVGRTVGQTPYLLATGFIMATYRSFDFL